MPEAVTRRKIAVKRIFTPENYEEIEPGSVLLNLERTSLWRAIEVKDGILSVFPYSGGCRYELLAETADTRFGLIEHPEDLPERIYL